jgi:EAL domain-containing protein (putative c-di-GMP-specific phosphodiesterase class I)
LDVAGRRGDPAGPTSGHGREAPNNDRLAALLAGLDHVAGSLGLSVAADGVSTAARLEVVQRLGLPHAQGDVVSPARPVDELQAMTTLASAVATP